MITIMNILNDIFYIKLNKIKKIEIISKKYTFN